MIKRLFRATLIMALAVFALSTSVVFAADEQEALADGADITGIRRMALAEPLYTQLKDGPTMGDVCQATFDAAVQTKVYVISYGDIAANIKRDTDVDIRALNHRQAMKIFKVCVPKYVDAYAVPTIANNNRKTVFYDVYQCGTNALLYRYQLTADKNAEDSYLTYRALSEQFYKKFDRAIENQKKRKVIDAEKKAKLDAILADPKARAEYEAKNERDRQRQLAKAEKKQAEEAKLQAKERAAADKEQMKREAKADKKRLKNDNKAEKQARKERKQLDKAERKAREKAEKASR